MKTLVLVAHPDIQASTGQQFLKAAAETNPDITYHYIDQEYPDGQIDVSREQDLLRRHQRIIFQFPLYWYSSPASLKNWQDQVLLEDFAHGIGENALAGKDLGLVISLGRAEKDYQVAGNEGFTLSALTSPFQATAKRLGMNFLKIFPIYQFSYKKEADQMRLLVAYLQYLTWENFDTLKSREDWMLNLIESQPFKTLNSKSADFILDQVTEKIEDQQLKRLELLEYIKN